MRPRCGGMLAGWLTSRANSSALQLRAVYPVNVKALAMRAVTSHAIASCRIHVTCGQVTGRDWCAYTHPERRTRHMPAPQVRTPILDAGSVGVPAPKAVTILDASCRQTRRPRQCRRRGKSVKTSALTVGPFARLQTVTSCKPPSPPFTGGLLMRPHLGAWATPARTGPLPGVQHEHPQHD